MLEQKQSNNREQNDDFGEITNSMRAHEIQKDSSVWGRMKAFVVEGTENAWVRLIIYCLACLLTSCIYFGWQDYSKLLIWGGAYEWKCTEGSEVSDDPDDPALCVDQSSAVNGLYAFANGSEFVCAAVAGVLLDSIGPRYTALLGETLQFVATLALALSSRSCQLYIPAIILTGACVNIICFPALTVMEAWPRHQALAISVIVGCQSAASVITPVLSRLWEQHPNWTYRGIWLVYLACLWFPITIAYIWALPRRRNYKSLLGDLEKPADSLSKLEAPDSTPHHTPQHETADCTPQHETADCTPQHETADCTPQPEIGFEPQTEACPSQPKTAKESWKKFGKELLTQDMGYMALFFALLMFQFAYYPAVLRDAVSPTVSDFVGWMTPLQGPFSFIIGFCMDYTGTILIMYCMCATLVFVNLSCAFGSGVTAYMKAVGVVFVFFQSATYNIKYTFVNEMYDPFNFGKLVGFLGICGGVGVYLSNPLTQSSSFATIFKSLGSIGFIMAGITTIMFVRQYVLKRTHKTCQGVQQSNRIAVCEP